MFPIHARAGCCVRFHTCSLSLSLSLFLFLESFALSQAGTVGTSVCCEDQRAPHADPETLCTFSVCVCFVASAPTATADHRKGVNTGRHECECCHNLHL